MCSQRKKCTICALCAQLMSIYYMERQKGQCVGLGAVWTQNLRAHSFMTATVKMCSWQLQHRSVTKDFSRIYQKYIELNMYCITNILGRKGIKVWIKAHNFYYCKKKRRFWGRHIKVKMLFSVNTVSVISVSTSVKHAHRVYKLLEEYS